MKNLISFKNINILPKVLLPSWVGGFSANLVFLLFLISVLTLALRGIPGSPTAEQLNQRFWKDDGPLELSPERGRFALTYSIIEDKSVHFSLPIARFATPDLGYKDGNYVSLFAHGVSFIVAPGYLLGKMFGLSQVGVYAMIAGFAILNAFLIRSIVRRLGGSAIAGYVAALTFLFATPSFVYAVSLFQHHVSICLLLMCIYILVRFKSIWSLSAVWFLATLSLSVDYPNFFMMLPIGIYGFLKLIPVTKIEDKVNIKIPVLGFLTFAAAILPLVFLLWFNQVSYGSPFQLAGTVASVQNINDQGKPAAARDSTSADLKKFDAPITKTGSAASFFNTRNMLTALNIHWLSPDRGVIFYTPVILLGFVGMIWAFRKKAQHLGLLISVMAANITLYSMWGDYWGGWAFGSRYITPAYAILAIFLGLLLTYWRRKSWFILLFGVLFCYSVGVNTLGAITSSANPPQVEVLALEKLSGQVQKYTYERNWDYLTHGISKSFVFQTIGHNYFNTIAYYQILVLLIAAPSLVLLIFLRLKNR